ncbi:mediator of RNA polymerase II transcription subunit 32 [Panicum miliaceum]|uniref:Mediator of RNA polymerase II transcription subunit 32 n=1 Tax=Panicum miliaceum TaxID=4540 RepID=A0A3L6TIU5_PANMI|nr:mediator of RNA polymerase II transcription subunit 32 [Panicum miliaceum]
MAAEAPMAAHAPDPPAAGEEGTVGSCGVRRVRSCRVGRAGGPRAVGRREDGDHTHRARGLQAALGALPRRLLRIQATRSASFGSRPAPLAAAPGIKPIRIVRLEQMSKAVRWLIIELQHDAGGASTPGPPEVVVLLPPTPASARASRPVAAPATATRGGPAGGLDPRAGAATSARTAATPPSSGHARHGRSGSFGPEGPASRRSATPRAGDLAAAGPRRRVPEDGCGGGEQRASMAGSGWRPCTGRGAWRQRTAGSSCGARASLQQVGGRLPAAAAAELQRRRTAPHHLISAGSSFHFEPRHEGGGGWDQVR